MRIVAPILALLLSVAPAITAAETDAWEIFLAARERAGASGVLQDYSYDFVTALPAGDNQQVEVRGSVVAILPDLIRQEMQTLQGPAQLYFDRGDAWQIVGGARMDLPEDAAALQQSELARRHVLFLEPPAKQLVRYRREEDVGGRIADVIEIIDVAGAPLRLYVDQETKDVLKQVFVGDIPGGGMAQVEEIYTEFQEVKGFRFPTRREIVRNGEPARTDQFQDLMVNNALQREIVLD